MTVTSITATSPILTEALDDMLGKRTRRHTPSPATESAFAGQTVLVTGAGGSIGSEIVTVLCAMNDVTVYLLDRDETLLQRTMFGISKDGLLNSDNTILVDIRDRKYLTRVVSSVKPDIVFHAAALKHLPLLENHPVEGVKSNIFGTQNVLHAARVAGAHTFVNISTDKAADPTSVLGATKHVAEQLTAEHNDTSMRAVSVRFGNVLGSRGSLLEVVQHSINAGTPIKLTDERMTRFFMTINEAAHLVIEAAAMTCEPGNLFVLDMGQPVRIIDLVTAYLSASGQQNPGITYTGLRAGEKLCEQIYATAETHQRTTNPRISQTTIEQMTRDEHHKLAGLEEAVFGAGRENDQRVIDMLSRLVGTYTPASPHAA